MKNLFKSLANFQQEIEVIHKETKGYGYSYAGLPTIFEAINPLMKKHGLGFTQLVNGQQIKTIIFHVESGETLESLTDIPQGVTLAKMNDFQVLGSAITYIRRYALSSILGLVTDKDTDAGGQQVKKPVTLTEKDLKVLKGKIATCTNKQQLTNLWYSNDGYKTNKEVVKLFTERQLEIQQA